MREDEKSGSSWGAGKANWVELAKEAHNSWRVWTKGRLGGQRGVCGITVSTMVVARALAVTTGRWRALRRRPHLSANLQMAGRGSRSENEFMGTMSMPLFGASFQCNAARRTA